MDIARSFSHGDHDEQSGRFALVESVRQELNIPIATLLDTKGPEIRTGALKDDKKVTLKEGQGFHTSTSSSGARMSRPAAAIRSSSACAIRSTTRFLLMMV